MPPGCLSLAKGQIVKGARSKWDRHRFRAFGRLTQFEKTSPTDLAVKATTRLNRRRLMQYSVAILPSERAMQANSLFWNGPQFYWPDSTRLPSSSEIECYMSSWRIRDRAGLRIRHFNYLKISTFQVFLYSFASMMPNIRRKSYSLEGNCSNMEAGRSSTEEKQANVCLFDWKNPTLATRCSFPLS